MSRTNPFRLAPAEDRHFIGRDDLLDAWRARLNSGSEDWKAGKNWLLIGTGGSGKTSLLLKLIKVGIDNFKAHPVYADLGEYHDRSNPEGFFESLEKQIAAAPDLGTSARKAVSLPPDASSMEIIYRSTHELLKLAGLAFNLTPGSEISPALPNYQRGKTEDYALRLAGVYEILKAIARRRKQPVILMIDQLDKAHDSEQWSDIARLLLACMLNFRRDGQVNIVFVVAMRPERYGLLDSKIQWPELFEPFLFERKYLVAFSHDEARQAIRKRGQGYISPNLEAGILRELTQSGKADPYAVIQAAAAIWAYLYAGDRQRSPSEIKGEDIRGIITTYYAELIRYFQNSSSLWLILKLLIHYPGGLSISEISAKLERTQITHGEVQDAVHRLMNQRGYQVISELPQPDDPPRYTIAHELLREALLKHIPQEQRLFEMARKTMEDAAWRFQHRGDSLSDTELRTIFEFKDELVPSAMDWNAIAYSIIKKFEPIYVDWLDSSNYEFIEATTRIVDKLVNPEETFRGFMILALSKNTDRDYRLKVLRLISQIADRKENRIQSVRELVSFGGEEPVISMILDLAANSEYSEVRWEAIEGLARIGEPSRQALLDLVKNSGDWKLRYRAAEVLIQMEEGLILEEIRTPERIKKDWKDLLSAAQALQQFGAKTRRQNALASAWNKNIETLVKSGGAKALSVSSATARQVLARLAKESSDLQVRRKATVKLANMGRAALKILVDLAKNSGDSEVHWEAAEGLARIGEPSRQSLLDLAKNSRDWQLRLKAAEALGRMGETVIAQAVLTELAKNSSDLQVGRMAAARLASMGKAALKILVDLAKNSGDSEVRWEAAEGLARIGEPSRQSLLDLAKNSRDWEVRYRAAEALSQMEEMLIPQEVFIELAKTSKDWQLRVRAAEALGRMGETVISQGVLEDLARNSTDEHIRYRAAELLCDVDEKIIPQEVLTYLAKNSQSWGLRLRAAEAVGTMGETMIAREVLLELATINGLSLQIRRKAAAGLARMDEAALDVLLDIAKNANDWVYRWETTAVLTGIGECSKQRLADLAKEGSDWAVRWKAAEELERLSDHSGFLILSLASPISVMIDMFIKKIQSKSLH